jgi:hypothetical protein
MKPIRCHRFSLRRRLPAANRHPGVTVSPSVGAFLVVALAALSGCSSRSDGAPPRPTTPTPSASPSRTPTPLASPSRLAAPNSAGDYLGCGAYCRTAGGYGGGGNEREVLRLANRTAKLKNNLVSLKVICDLDVTCRGAIVLFSHDASTEVGRSDLLVKARSSRRIAVPVSPGAVDELHRRGQLLVEVVLDGGLIQPCPSDVSCVNLNASLVVYS